MADYAKLVIKGLYSKSSDYSDPKVGFSPAAYTLSADEYFHAEIDADTGSGNIIDTGTFAGGVSLVAVKNNDPLISLRAIYQNLATAVIEVIIPPGGLFTTPDFTYVGNLLIIAVSGTVECEVFIVGT